MPDDIIGVVPNSINVPLLLAIIIRSQYIGSDVSDDTMPYRGIWLMTKKIKSVSCPVLSNLAVSMRVLEPPYPCPHHFLIERYFALGSCHLRKEGRKRFYQVEEAYYRRVSLRYNPMMRACTDRLQKFRGAEYLQPLILIKEGPELPAGE
jgi:hypothetical protein